MEGKQIGSVFNYFEHVGVAAVELTGSIKLGDTLRFVGGETDFTEVVDSIQIDKNKVQSAKKGDQVGIKVSERVHKGYRVYKVA
jgi:putative protease